MADVETRDSDPVWQSTPRSWPHPWRGRPRWVVVLVVVALVAALTAGGLWLRSVLAGPQAETGEFVADPIVTDLIDSADVELPWGTLKVRTGRPVDRIPERGLYSDKFDTTLDQIDAPDDGSWVALKIEPAVSFDVGPYRASAAATIPATAISVVSGGRALPIARAAGGSGAKTTGGVVAAQLAPAIEGYLALPDRPGDLHLRVEFDGVRQDAHLTSGTIDKGRAAPLYRKAERVDVACSSATVPGFRSAYPDGRNCGMNRLLSLPWVAGLGWAESGRTWLVTTVWAYAPPKVFRTSVGQQRGSYVTATFRDGTTQLRYGNATPRARVRFNDVRGVFRDVEDTFQYVFDVASSDRGKGTFTATTRFTARLADGADQGLVGLVDLTATRTIRP